MNRPFKLMKQSYNLLGISNTRCIWATPKFGVDSYVQYIRNRLTKLFIHQLIPVKILIGDISLGLVYLFCYLSLMLDISYLSLTSNARIGWLNWLIFNLVYTLSRTSFLSVVSSDIWCATSFRTFQIFWPFEHYPKEE